MLFLILTFISLGGIIGSIIFKYIIVRKAEKASWILITEPLCKKVKKKMARKIGRVFRINDIIDYILTGSCIVCVICFVITMTNALTYSDIVPCNTKLESVVEIEPMTSSSTYFMEDCQYYYFNSQNGAIKIAKAECSINYNENENPRIETYILEPDENETTIFVPFCIKLKNYQIYVPTDTQRSINKYRSK